MPEAAVSGPGSRFGPACAPKRDRAVQSCELGARISATREDLWLKYFQRPAAAGMFSAANRWPAAKEEEDKRP